MGRQQFESRDYVWVFWICSIITIGCWDGPEEISSSKWKKIFGISSKFCFVDSKNNPRRIITTYWLEKVVIALPLCWEWRQMSCRKNILSFYKIHLGEFGHMPVEMLCPKRQVWKISNSITRVLIARRATIDSNDSMGSTTVNFQYSPTNSPRVTMLDCSIYGWYQH